MPRSVLSVFDVTPRRIGGVEVFARELSHQLGGHGWESILAFDSPPPEVVRSYLQLPNVTLDSLDFRTRPARDFSALLRKHRPEIVHLYFTGFISPYPWIASLHGARQVLFTDQGSHPPGYVPHRAPAWKRAAARIINRPLDRVICISDYNARCMVARGLTQAARVVRIHNAVDMEQPCGDGAGFRRKFGIPADRAVVLQVSSIIPEKGIPDLLDAAGIVVARHPSAHFVFVGDGAYQRDYAGEAEKRGLSGHITWTGLIGNPAGDGVYAGADVVCLASRWQEAFGWVLAEAMACRRAIVATSAGAIPEVVTGGVTGYLVPVGKAAELADKILVLLADPALRDRMGAAARQDAEKRFDVRRNVAELIGLYSLST